MKFPSVGSVNDELITVKRFGTIVFSPGFQKLETQTDVEVRAKEMILNSLRR